MITEGDLQAYTINQLQKLPCAILRINGGGLATETGFYSAYITYPDKLTAGCSDLIVLPSTRAAIFIEIKKPFKQFKRRPAQIRFQQWATKLGLQYLIFNNPDQADALAEQLKGEYGKMYNNR